MKIQIDPHTVERAEERGASRDEIEDVIRNGRPIPAKSGRQARAKVYRYGRERQGKHFDHRRVEVIYVTEGEAVVTVTVYVFYGKWEESDADHL